MCYSNVIYIVYILIPDKKESLEYCHMFKALKSLKPIINSKSIKMDYERVTFNAIEKEFPDTEKNGLFLSNLIKCMASCPRIGTKKNISKSFHRNCKCLKALNFISDAGLMKYNPLHATSYFINFEDIF